MNPRTKLRIERTTWILHGAATLALYLMLHDMIGEAERYRDDASACYVENASLHYSCATAGVDQDVLTRYATELERTRDQLARCRMERAAFLSCPDAVNVYMIDGVVDQHGIMTTVVTFECPGDVQPTIPSALPEQYLDVFSGSTR